MEGFRDGVWTAGEGVIRSLGETRGCAWLALHTRGWHPLRSEPEKLRVEVVADGRPLVPAGTFEHGFLFRLDPPLDRIDTLRVRSAAIPPEAVGAAASGPPLGLDVASVELADERSVAALATRHWSQPVTGPLQPEQVWDRSGFYRDFGWTDGVGRLGSLLWEVPSGSRRLVLDLHPVHPLGAAPDRLGVRLLVNGVELERGVSHATAIPFRLHRGLGTIEEVRILSSTFVPRELNGSADERTLGVPVRSLRLE